MERIIPILFFLIFIGLIAAAVAFAISFSVKQAKELGEVYALLAARFGGTAERGNWTSRPSARFVYNGASVLVDIYSTGGKHPQYYSQVHVSWADPALRLEVYPESFFARVGKFLGMQDIEIGSPEFDEAYIITGHDPEAIKRFLSSGVQAAIGELRKFGPNREIYVSANGGTLLVKKLGQYRDFESLARLVVLSLELFEQGLLTYAGDITFIDQPSPGTGPPVCQVCGDEISADLVQCRSCKSPHHKECWTYYGACSTYGCGEKRFMPGCADGASSSSRRGKL